MYIRGRFQGTEWSLIGSAHGHVDPEKADTTQGSPSLYTDADMYTAEVCELYSVCLAKALFEKGLTRYSRASEYRDSELRRKMTSCLS